MNCPQCTAPMDIRIIDDLEFDECPQCNGIWFDQGEFDLAKKIIAPDLRWLDFEIWQHPEYFELKPHPLNCPRCGVELFAINYATTGVQIDVCPREHGVWLEDGEFEKILDGLNLEAVTASVSDYVKASVAEGKEIFTGKAGLKSEWQDFTTVLRLMQYRLFIEKPRLLRELIEASKGAPIW